MYIVQIMLMFMYTFMSGFRKGWNSGKTFLYVLENSNVQLFTIVYYVPGKFLNKIPTVWDGEKCKDELFRQK